MWSLLFFAVAYLTNRFTKEETHGRRAVGSGMLPGDEESPTHRGHVADQNDWELWATRKTDSRPSTTCRVHTRGFVLHLVDARPVPQRAGPAGGEVQTRPGCRRLTSAPVSALTKKLLPASRTGSSKSQGPSATDLVVYRPFPSFASQLPIYLSIAPSVQSCGKSSRASVPTPSSTSFSTGRRQAFAATASGATFQRTGASPNFSPAAIDNLLADGPAPAK
ncbi:hypothetical protein PWT90_04326 [Aphanocladium album]|nr:hypothetical protein PWT90_04326 [Aphanocladium album]